MVSVFSVSYLFLQSPLHTPPTIPNCTSANFHLHISSPYMFTKPSLQSPLTLPSSITQPFFVSLFLHTVILATPNKCFLLSQPFSRFRLCQELNEQVHFVWTDTVVISPCFPEAWTGITALAITDSSLLRLTILVYCSSCF